MDRSTLNKTGGATEIPAMLREAGLSLTEYEALINHLFEARRSTSGPDMQDELREVHFAAADARSGLWREGATTEAEKAGQAERMAAYGLVVTADREAE